jgi:hypothetical protein
MKILRLFLATTALLTGCKPSLDYSKWDNGIGTFIVLGGGRGVHSKVRYVYNDKVYEEFGDRSTYIYGMTYDEKYEIKINPQNPREFIVLDWLPIFTKDEETSFTKAKVIRLFKFRYFGNDSFTSKYGVEFLYTLDGIEMSRSQHLPPECDGYCNLKKGAFYKLEVWNDNVYRSKLHWDKPIN